MSTKLFWFSKIGTRDSFSRIAEAILPILKKRNFQLYTIVPPTLELSSENEKLFTNILRMGQNIDEGGLKLDEKEFMAPLKENLGSKMKYIVLQVLAHCQAQGIDTLLITMGVYEADWFMETIESIRKTETANYLLNNIKVVLYVPFDYIPSQEAIKDLLKADVVITTVPYLVDIFPFDDWVGHANDQRFKKLEDREGVVWTRERLIRLINSMKERFWKSEIKKIEEGDLIILNANLFGERKRIDITIKAFENALDHEHDKRLLLWLHGGYDESLEISDRVRKRLIISNKVLTSELNLIYNVAQIGINTSWGEGWSLTNCEHAITGAIQVVPDWLACKFHFGENRGLLIKVDETESVNEAQAKVIIGVPNQLSANLKLLEAIVSREWDPEPTIKYINQYTWESAAEKLIRVLKEI